jgi:drug/metabolite transporter (DMT)-like permease
VAGWLVFGQLPDLWGWVGMAIVAACGATTAWLNLRNAAADRRQAGAPVAADTVAD